MPNNLGPPRSPLPIFLAVQPRETSHGYPPVPLLQGFEVSGRFVPLSHVGETRGHNHSQGWASGEGMRATDNPCADA